MCVFNISHFSCSSLFSHAIHRRGARSLDVHERPCAVCVCRVGKRGRRRRTVKKAREDLRILPFVCLLSGSNTRLTPTLAVGVASFIRDSATRTTGSSQQDRSPSKKNRTESRGRINHNSIIISIRHFLIKAYYRIIFPFHFSFTFFIFLFYFYC